MTKPKKPFYTTPHIDPTSYFVTAQPTSTRYFVTRILINKETDVTYLHFAGFFRPEKENKWNDQTALLHQYCRPSVKNKSGI